MMTITLYLVNITFLIGQDQDPEPLTQSLNILMMIRIVVLNVDPQVSLNIFIYTFISL